MTVAPLAASRTLWSTGHDSVATNRTMVLCAVPWAHGGAPARNWPAHAEVFYRLAWELARRDAAQADFRLRAMAASLN